MAVAEPAGGRRVDDYLDVWRRWERTQRGTVAQADAWVAMISAFNRLTDAEQDRMVARFGPAEPEAGQR
jgi:hypothetical protein